MQTYLPSAPGAQNAFTKIQTSAKNIETAFNDADKALTAAKTALSMLPPTDPKRAKAQQTVNAAQKTYDDALAALEGVDEIDTQAEEFLNPSEKSEETSTSTSGSSAAAKLNKAKPSTIKQKIDTHMQTVNKAIKSMRNSGAIIFNEYEQLKSIYELNSLPLPSYDAQKQSLDTQFFNLGVQHREIKKIKDILKLCDKLPKNKISWYKNAINRKITILKSEFSVGKERYYDAQNYTALIYVKKYNSPNMIAQAIDFDSFKRFARYYNMQQGWSADYDLHGPGAGNMTDDKLNKIINQYGIKNGKIYIDVALEKLGLFHTDWYHRLDYGANFDYRSKDVDIYRKTNLRKVVQAFYPTKTLSDFEWFYAAQDAGGIQHGDSINLFIKAYAKYN